MMSGTMKMYANISKITPPRLPQILNRPRLIDHLDKNKDKLVILILGQAAQGKSTLAASYVASANVPAAWVNLSEDDSDPVNLFYSLVHALQHALKDTDLSSLVSYPSVSMGPREEIPLYREWTNAIAEHISAPIHIVLDALDRLSPDAPSFMFIKTLINQAPPHMHFFLLSREMPPLDLQGLKIKQEAHLLTNEDLAFTPDEVRAFFREMRGFPFTATQAKRIHQFTEGWIGGLILLSETLDGLPEASREKYVLEDIPDRFKQEAFNYFGEEILSSQSDPIQDFLIKSSILDILEPGFVKDLLDIENAEEILQEHARRNLFVTIANDETKGPLFRYHQLFRDFLKSRFKRVFDNEDKQALFRKAGSLYEQRGEFEQAVGLYLEAKAFDRAAGVIERICMALLGVGRKGDLSRWLQAFPEDVVQGNPWLLFCRSITRRFTAVEENMHSLQEALTLFEKQGDIRGHMLSLGFLIEATVNRGRDSISLSILLENAETLLSSVSSDLYPHEMAALLFQTGFGYALRGGDPRKAIRACQNAHLLAVKADDVMLQLNALIVSLIPLTYLGEFSVCEKTSEKIESSLKKTAYSELVVYHTKVLSELAIFKGDFDRAAELLHLLNNKIDKYGLVYLVPPALYSEFLLGMFTEEPAKTEETGERLLSIASAIDHSYAKGLCFTMLGVHYYRKGDFQKGKNLIKRGIKVYSSNESGSELHMHWGELVLGLTSLHLQDRRTVEKMLMKALNYFEKIQSHTFMMESHFALALFHFDSRERDTATLHIQAGFKIAIQRGYDHFMSISQNDMAKVCILAFELEVPKAADYAAHLLTTRLASHARPELERLSRHPNLRLREKAREIKRAIHRSKVPGLRIETLGGFQVFRNESPLPENDWQGNQPKTLLKAIVARGSKPASIELIMEELWPDSESPEKNLKVALHRLRKSLEPETDKTFGSSYIHLKGNMLSLDKELIEIDVAKFLSLIKEGEANENSDDVKVALSLYKEAIDLYKGDFLTEELYTQWAEVQREELRRTYLNLLLKVARIYEDRWALNKAISLYKKAIQTDPLSEGAYQRLMSLYSRKGKQNEALKAYEACKKALRDEIDTEPDHVTTSIYNKIRG